LNDIVDFVSTFADANFEAGSSGNLASLIQQKLKSADI
jgi:hypothetical protein